MSTALAPSVTRHDKIVKGTSCHLRTIRDKLSGGPIVRGPVAKRFDRALISRKRVFARCCRPFNRSTRPTGTSRWHFCSAGKKIRQFEPNNQKNFRVFLEGHGNNFKALCRDRPSNFLRKTLFLKWIPSSTLRGKILFDIRDLNPRPSGLILVPYGIFFRFTNTFCLL